MGNDGDFLALVREMLEHRSEGITEVKGHADEELVREGQVREQDRVGNDGASEAADLGRRRVEQGFIDARRNLSGVCRHWNPVVLDLQCFSLLSLVRLWNSDELADTLE